LAPFIIPNNNSLYLNMKNLLFFTFLAVTAISCDKKDDNNNTNSIEGRWTLSEQVENYSQVGSISITVPGMPAFDTTIVLDSTSTVITPAADLDGSGIEFLSNGTAYLFDEDGNEDTTTYTYSNNTLNLVIPEGSENGLNDSTYIIPVSNLTSNSADLLFAEFTESENEVDSSFGTVTTTDFTISYSIIWKVIK
jgi:hypothetical protein